MPTSDYEKYRSWYLAREASPEGVRKRRLRAQARREAIRDGRLNGKDDPREVDHVRSLDKGGTSARSNTQIISRTANRRKYT